MAKLKGPLSAKHLEPKLTIISFGRKTTHPDGEGIEMECASNSDLA